MSHDLTHQPLIYFFYHSDGAGILVSRDVYEGIRQAQPSDVRTVEEIIRPLEDQVLSRSTPQAQSLISNFILF